MTPDDLAASCGSSTVPNLNTEISILNANHAQFFKRNTSGSWNPANQFSEQDLANANVEMIQDNSTSVPSFDFSLTDGANTLTQPANISFSLSPSFVNVSQITFTINQNGVTLLNAQQFLINDTSTKLDNIVITPIYNQGGSGYFSTVNNPSTPLNDFTYYQLQQGQIQFVYNGTQLPNITLSVGNGKAHPALIYASISFFKTNDAKDSSMPIITIVTSGGVPLVALTVGLTTFGIFKHRRNQKRREEMDRKIPELKAVANPLQVSSSDVPYTLFTS